MRGSGRLGWVIGCSVVGGWLLGACEGPAKEEERAETRIKVEVLNGCKEPGIARKFARILRWKGLDVVNGDGANAENFGFLETIVVDRSGDMEKAWKVAGILGTKNCIQQVIADRYRVEEVTVVIGKDFRELSVE